MKKSAAFLIVVMSVFIGAALAYVSGRILLPEMGLTAPGYWTWFWAAVFTGIATFIGAFLKGIINEIL